MVRNARIMSGIITLFIVTSVFLALMSNVTFIEEIRGDDPPVSTQFNPPHSHYSLDTNEDGIFDALTLNVSFSISEEGNYTLFGQLFHSSYGGDGGEFNESWVQYFPGDFIEIDSQVVETGNHILPLIFNTFPIYNSNTNVDWIIDLTLLNDDDQNIEDIDTYTINILTHDDYEVPKAELVPYHSDYGIDNNSDSKYDWLVVNVTFDINENESLQLSGGLFNGNWSQTLEVTVYNANFIIGNNQTVALWFNVTNHSSEIGPYDVVLNISGTTQTFTETCYIASVESFEY